MQAFAYANQNVVARPPCKHIDVVVDATFKTFHLGVLGLEGQLR